MPRYSFCTVACVRRSTQDQWCNLVRRTLRRSISMGYSVDEVTYWFETDRTAWKSSSRARSRYALIWTGSRGCAAIFASSNALHDFPALVTTMTPSGRTALPLKLEGHLDERL